MDRDSSDIASDYGTPLDTGFTAGFSAVRLALCCALWLAGGAYAGARHLAVRRSGAATPLARTWPLYGILAAALSLALVREALFCAYATMLNRGSEPPVALATTFIAFDNMASSTFAAVLIVVASGYCVTRDDLGPHAGRVICVGFTLLTCGLLKDLLFQAFQLAQSSPGSYDLVAMSTPEVLLFLFGTLAWACALVLAWLYTFGSLSEETRALKTAHQTLQGISPSEERLPVRAGARARAVGGGGSDDYSALEEAEEGNGTGGGTGGRAAGRTSDPGGSQETVADRLAYTTKLRLLRSFSIGVGLFFSTSICLEFLPVFVLAPIQQLVGVLQFTAYIAFIAVLLYIFRPQHESPYLLAGRDDAEAETKGHAGGLATQIAMVETSTGGRGAAGRNGTGAAQGNGNGAPPSPPLRNVRWAPLVADGGGNGATFRLDPARRHSGRRQPGGLPTLGRDGPLQDGSRFTLDDDDDGTAPGSPATPSLPTSTPPARSQAPPGRGDDIGRQ